MVLAVIQMAVILTLVVSQLIEQRKRKKNEETHGLKRQTTYAYYRLLKRKLPDKTSRWLRFVFVFCGVAGIAFIAINWILMITNVAWGLGRAMLTFGDVFFLFAFLLIYCGYRLHAVKYIRQHENNASKTLFFTVKPEQILIEMIFYILFLLPPLVLIALQVVDFLN